MTVLASRAYVEEGKKIADRAYAELKEQFRDAFGDDGIRILDDLIETAKSHIDSDAERVVERPLKAVDATDDFGR